MHKSTERDLKTITTDVAVLAAALSSKGWHNHLFHFAIPEAAMPNFFLMAGFRCVQYMYAYMYISIHKGSEFADMLSAGDYKAVASNGKACIRPPSGKCLNSAVTTKTLSRQDLHHSNICQILCSNQMLIGWITGNRDNNSDSFSCHFKVPIHSVLGN